MEVPEINIKALENLLRAKEDESSDDDEPIKSLSGKLGPGNVGPTNKSSSSSEPKKSVYEKARTKDIWDENEVEEGAEFDARDDPRAQPDYEILYKQKLTSEDIFLQMGNKNPSSSCCEDMIVKIRLPGVGKISEIEINVYDNNTMNEKSEIISRLGLHLPHPVHSKASSAKWDANNSTLNVTMTMNRELDFLNA